jgi:hypothetical protein
VLTYPGAKRAVVIPEYEEIDVDIIKNNMRTVSMTREQYFDAFVKNPNCHPERSEGSLRKTECIIIADG